MVPKNEDIYDKKRVGAVLKDLRKRKGFHVRTEVTRAGGYEEGSSAFFFVESGRVNLTMKTLKGYSKALEMPISEIFREIEKGE